jgi:uncharacterized protein YbaR (Trm112 family)
LSNHEKICFKVCKKGEKMVKEIISEDLLEILACPACKGDIELITYQDDQHGLKCAKCKCIYPIKDGIPVMLIDEAIPAE